MEQNENLKDLDAIDTIDERSDLNGLRFDTAIRLEVFWEMKPDCCPIVSCKEDLHQYKSQLIVGENLGSVKGDRDIRPR